MVEAEVQISQVLEFADGRGDVPHEIVSVEAHLGDSRNTLAF